MMKETDFLKAIAWIMQIATSFRIIMDLLRGYSFSASEVLLWISSAGALFTIYRYLEKE